MDIPKVHVFNISVIISVGVAEEAYGRTPEEAYDRIDESKLWMGIARTFDKESYLRRAKMLQANRIRGHVLIWIKSWRQKMTTLLAGQWGVPQASVLEPILVVIFISYRRWYLWMVQDYVEGRKNCLCKGRKKQWDIKSMCHNCGA